MSDYSDLVAQMKKAMEGVNITNSSYIVAPSSMKTMLDLKLTEVTHDAEAYPALSRWYTMASLMPVTYFPDIIFTSEIEERDEGKERTEELIDEIYNFNIFLSAPYNSKYRHIEKWRVEAATFITSYLMSRGVTVHSPITHGDAIYESSLRSGVDLPKDFQFWRKNCLWGIDSADAVVVLELDGWMDSKGIKAEIEYAESKDKPVFYMLPELVPGFVQYMNEWQETYNKN